MPEVLQFLERYGYAVVFAVVLFEQLGLPIPALPVLLGAGALAGDGRLSFGKVILLAVAASLAADSLWYGLGRSKGQSILRLLCRISLEPDSCVGSTKSWFERLGASSLLIAKFVPGLSTAAPPMAGATWMPRWQFLLYDIAGSALWAGSFTWLGYLFRHQIQAIADQLARMGSAAAGLLLAALAGYLGYKYWQRRRFILSLRAVRVEPQTLLGMIESGEPVTILDLRHAIDFAHDAMRIPGATWFNSGELAQHNQDIPRDRDIILYCS